MSREHTGIPLLEEDEPEVTQPAPGSLEARVAQRRLDLEKRKTELFDVPGFGDIFKVELQVIGGKRQYTIGRQHQHIADEYRQNVNIAADLILAATVGFHSVVGEGTQPAEGTTWKRLALAFDKTLDSAKLEAKGGGRLAILRLLGEEGVVELAGTWKRWIPTRGQEVERELEDF